MTVNIAELSDEISKVTNKNYDINAVNKDVLNTIRTVMFKLFEELIKTYEDLNRIEKDDPTYKEINKSLIKLYSAVKSLLHKYNSEISAVRPIYQAYEQPQQPQQQ